MVNDGFGRRFLGMVIAMYYNDQAPPHFHVRYGRQKAVIGIEPIALLAGTRFSLAKPANLAILGPIQGLASIGVNHGQKNQIAWR